MGGDEFVGLGIPLIVINAVQDSSHGLCPLLEHTLQAETKFGSLDFLAILSAHGRDHVRVSQRALQKINVAEVLHFCNGEQIPRQHKQGQNLRRKQSLVSHVVDGEDHARIVECRIFRVLRSQQQRDERRLPIVAMKNVGHAEDLRAFQHRAAK